MTRWALTVVVAALAGCAASVPDPSRGASGTGQSSDQIPRYGGMDRQADPLLRQADEKLIADTQAHYGSREKASAAFADQGFRFYRQDDLVQAMRRFNQAWLLDPENGDAYWGFAGVASDRKQYCEAAGHFRTGLSKPRVQSSAFSDAGYAYAACASTYPADKAAPRNDLIRDSEAAFVEATTRGAPADYVLNGWMRARAETGNFAGAWQKVKEFRRVAGTEPPASFLDRLGKQMVEPE